MKALISGQAGLAVLFDGDRIYSLDCDDRRETPREESDISYLFADTTDVAELVHTSREVVVEALELARHKDEALHLFIILLDGDADKEARGLAAECLEELTGDPRVFDSIANRLYAAPLPDNSDLVGALIHADKVQALQLAIFLDELGLHQPDIRRWRAAWDALSFELFPKPEMKEEFGYRLVISGALRKLVQSNPEDIDGILYQCLMDPEFRSLPNHRRILMDLLGPFRPVKRNVHLEPESDQEHIARPSRARRGVGKPKRSSIVFETIIHQREAIKRLLSEGNARRALKYVDDLVKYQGSRSEIQDLARSLCDLAQHAKNIGDHEAQLSLAQRAVEMLLSDGWSQAQLGDAFLRLGKHEEALAAYDAARDFGSGLVARCGRAEVLKALGRLDEALNEYESAAEVFPGSVVARNSRAEVLKALGRLDEALNEYESAARDFPLDVVPRNGRAEVLKALGRLDEALNEYDSAARDFPHDVVARCGRASVLALLGRYQEALDLISSGSPRTFAEWVAYHIRGMVLLKQGHLDAAIEILERGARQNPWVIGRTYFQSGLAVARLK